MMRHYFLLLLLLTLIILPGCALKQSATSDALVAENNTEIPATASISEVLKANDHLPVADRVDLYRQLRKEKPEAYNFWNQDELTMYGYGLLWGEKTTEAIEVFKLMVAEFPNTANNYDSLGEAYLANGDEKKALFNYQKALETILTIQSFNFYPWNNLDVYEAFMDKTFRKIAAGDIEHLIIDLRYNGGGSAESSIYLLRHLMRQPFTYFSRTESEGKREKAAGEYVQQPFDTTYKGKLYFLIDGIGNSTTGHFMSLAKKWELGTIVGEELGSNQFCSAGQTVCRLSNTKVIYYVANNTNVSTATSLPDETGILPDHYVSQSIDDYLNKVDTVMEFTIGLTRE